jgi:hypothetical protein
VTPTDQLHLNAAAGHLQLGDAMDAWHDLEQIAPLNRAQTEVLSVRSVGLAQKLSDQAKSLFVQCQRLV